MIKLIVVCCAGAFIATMPAAGHCEEGEHYVGVEWRWFTDYIYMSSEWTLDAEDGCELEYGTGMMVRNTPLGGKHRFSSHVEFSTYGFGAIHVRAVSGLAPCLVKLRQGNVRAVGIYSDPSVIKGAIHDGKIIYEKAKDAAGAALDNVK
jgi:hypothetical protein